MEINGVDRLNASVREISDRRDVRLSVVAFVALVRSGFRRYATYRQATAAGIAVNTIFGFLKCYVLLAVAGTAAGYTGRQLASFVWVGQGLLTVVLLWGWTELADRIRSGEVISDLLRPVPPVAGYLAADLGRAGHAMVTRFVVPLMIGFFAFDLYVPGRWSTWPLFAVSVLLAVVASFCCRFLANVTAHWLADARGPLMIWTTVSGVLTGMYFPLRFLPEPLDTILWLATPFPGLMQTPLDVFVEVDPTSRQVWLVAMQAGWALALLALCQWTQRRAEHRMVAQGG